MYCTNLKVYLKKSKAIAVHNNLSEHLINHLAMLLLLLLL